MIWEINALKWISEAKQASKDLGASLLNQTISKLRSSIALNPPEGGLRGVTVHTMSYELVVHYELWASCTSLTIAVIGIAMIGIAIGL